MPASPRISRRRLLVALGALVLVAVVAAAVVALRPDGEPVAGATPSASSTASSGAVGGAGGVDEGGPGAEPTDGGSPEGEGSDAEPGPGSDQGAAPEARETLDPAPFGAVATPGPGVTVTVRSVEDVTGEANVPGEVGGPALRFTVELTNGTGEVLDLRTVVVNAYYGPDRTPATQLLEPGGRAFESEVGADDAARGVFVFSVPPGSQDRVELEIDPGVGAAIVIFAGV
jgi:hypothetical protein